jgi:hypothetical protein
MINSWVYFPSTCQKHFFEIIYTGKGISYFVGPSSFFPCFVFIRKAEGNLLSTFQTLKKSFTPR